MHRKFCCGFSHILVLRCKIKVSGLMMHTCVQLAENTLQLKVRYESSLHNYSINNRLLPLSQLDSFRLITNRDTNGFLFFFLIPIEKPDAQTVAEVTRYSSEEMNSGNESNESHLWTDQERQADFNRRKEELMKRKRRRKKRTSSSIQSSCFQGRASSHA